MDSVDVKDERDEQLVMDKHYAAIKRHRLWGRSLKIFVPENNYGMPDHLENMVQHHGDVKTFYQKEGKPGVYKDQRMTNTYRWNMQMALCNNRICFSEDFFTTSPGKTVKSMKNFAQNQMETMQYINKDARDEFGKNRRKLTGKIGGQQDDLLITLMQGYTWGSIICTDPRYIKMSRQL